MTVHRVEIYEVRENESFFCVAQLALDGVHALGIAGRMDAAGDALPGEENLNLPYRHGGCSGGTEAIQHRLRRGSHRKIMPVACACVRSAVPHERPRDDPAQAP